MRTITREQYDRLVELREKAAELLEALDTVEDEALSFIEQEPYDRDWLFDTIWNGVEVDYALSRMEITIEEDNQ